jgi:hypothetical protein
MASQGSFSAEAANTPVSSATLPVGSSRKTSPFREVTRGTEKPPRKQGEKPETRRLTPDI